VQPLSHIGINAVFLRPGMGGIETYVRCLMPELVTLRPESRFTLFLSAAGHEALRGEPWIGEVEVARHPLLGVPRLSAISEMTLLAALVRRRRIQLLNSVALTGPRRLGSAAYVLTVGDLTWLTEAGSVPRGTRAVWRATVPSAARHADRVLTYSEAARRDIVQMLGIAPERIDAVPLGPGLSESAAPTPAEELRRRLDLGDGPLVLAVGANRPNKNPLRLIESMNRVAESAPGAMLVMPGPVGPYHETLRGFAGERGLASSVRFPGLVSSEDLNGLYAAASCVAVPSTHEGFGLVVLEAMRRGAPVACSRMSSLPEVAGEAAAYFDPLDPADIARAVVEVITDAALAGRLAAEGRERSRAFTWKATAEGTLECFERALAAKAPHDG
jgi:glycosyltransferase involved in cell wall biosynthesis